MKSSIGILDVLLVVFIVLKLTGVINWSWWLVFSPLFAGIIIFIGFCVYDYFLIVNEHKYSKTLMRWNWK